MLFDLISKAALNRKISDIVIKEGDPMWVRHNGDLMRVESSEISRTAILELLRNQEESTFLSTAGLEDRLRDGSGDLDFPIQIGNARFRVNLYFTNGQRLAMAMRRLSEKAPPLDTLGLPPSFFNRLLNQSKGLILITGATGSGKTTTLASTINHFNETTSRHIITLEDPVEYLIPSERSLVDQRQIGRDAKSFSQGLRAALREDPDILLIGELRDHDTILTALTAATTGHLVFGSLHTNSAKQSVERITSEFSADRREWAHMVLSQALLGCVSQTLVPKADGSGQVLAAEIMICTPDIRSAIRDGKTSSIFNHMDTGSSHGQVLLNNNLKTLVQAGVIGIEEALYASYDPGILRKEFNRG